MLDVGLVLVVAGEADDHVLGLLADDVVWDARLERGAKGPEAAWAFLAVRALLEPDVERFLVAQVHKVREHALGGHLAQFLCHGLARIAALLGGVAVLPAPVDGACAEEANDHDEHE